MDDLARIRFYPIIKKDKSTIKLVIQAKEMLLDLINHMIM